MATAEEAMKKAEEALEAAHQAQHGVEDLDVRVSDLENICGDADTGGGHRKRSLVERVKYLESICRPDMGAMARGEMKREERDRDQSTLEGGKVPTGEI